MPYMKSGTPFLYDDTTGDIIGLKDQDGSEKSLMTMDAAGAMQIGGAAPTDEQVAAINGALGAGGGAKPLRTIGLGDSNCFGYGNSPWSSFYESAVSKSGGKLVGVKNAGVPGENSDAISKRVLTDVMPYAPDLVIVQIGTNDNRVASAILPYLSKIINTVIDYSETCIVLVCSTFPARSGSAAALALLESSLVAEYSSSRVRFCDTAAALSVDGTGVLRTDYSNDDVHLTTAGGDAAGAAILASIADLLVSVEVPTTPTVSSASTSMFLANGNFSTDTTGWSADGTGVLTRVTDQDVSGGVLRATFGVGGGGFIRYTPQAGFGVAAAQGRRMFVKGKIRVDGSGAESYTGQATNSAWGDCFTISNTQGTFSTKNNFTEIIDYGWRDFYVEFDVSQASAYSTAGQIIAAIVSPTGGPVIVDVAETYAGVVNIKSKTIEGPQSVSVSANTVLLNQRMTAVDCTGGARQITLPPVGLATGPIVVIKADGSANAVTVVPVSGTINGAASMVLAATQYANATFYPIGANWFAA